MDGVVYFNILDECFLKKVWSQIDKQRYHHNGTKEVRGKLAGLLVYFIEGNFLKRKKRSHS